MRVQRKNPSAPRTRTAPPREKQAVQSRETDCSGAARHQARDSSTYRSAPHFPREELDLNERLQRWENEGGRTVNKRYVRSRTALRGAAT
jgi:hypothetical protein